MGGKSRGARCSVLIGALFALVGCTDDVVETLPEEARARPMSAAELGVEAAEDLIAWAEEAERSAAGVAASCSGSGPGKVPWATPAEQAVFAELCRWPEERARAALRALPAALLGADCAAPLLDEWLAYFEREEFRAVGAEELALRSVQSILMSRRYLGDCSGMVPR